LTVLVDMVQNIRYVRLMVCLACLGNNALESTRTRTA
jgi:hypothetical protein